MNTLLEALSERKVLLGMVHLGPLPGSPGARGVTAAESLTKALEAARHDAWALLEGGFDGLVIENFFDVPFYPDRVPPVVVSSMTRIASALRDELGKDGVIVGVNVLRNDASAALGIAAANRLDFIRVNVHSGAMVTDQGLIQGRAHETLRERARLDADVAIMADVLVKHALPLGATDPSAAAVAEELVGRALADALIVTGRATGARAGMNELKNVKAAVPNCPVLVGSGIDSENVRAYLEEADGCIVGSSLKEGDEVRRPVDEDKVRALVTAARG